LLVCLLIVLSQLIITVCDEIEYEITPDNYQEYRSMIPDRVFNSFQMAVSEPSIIQPCDSTTWYFGDSMVVIWQGAAIYGKVHGSQMMDSIRVKFPMPIWYYNMELYLDGEYVETISPPNHRHRTEPLDIESLDAYGGSFDTKIYPLEEISECIEDNTPGSGYQIRMIIWDEADSRMSFNHSKCIELWSDRFQIDEPWLEILEPNRSTVWREDSNDVHVEYIPHGSFGCSSPEMIAPRIRLFQEDEEITTFYAPRYFDDGNLTCCTAVDNRWGNGSGFRICLEMNGERYFSDFFEIFGQTIRILEPNGSWVNSDSFMKIRWCSTAAPEDLNDQELREDEYFLSSGETVSIELYGFDQITGSRYLLETLAHDVQNDGLFYYVNRPNEDWIDEFVQLKIVDTDGNYGWSKGFRIIQYRHWF
jgi:hypothetical protein